MMMKMILKGENKKTIVVPGVTFWWYWHKIVFSFFWSTIYYSCMMPYYYIYSRIIPSHLFLSLKGWPWDMSNEKIKKNFTSYIFFFTNRINNFLFCVLLSQLLDLQTYYIFFFILNEVLTSYVFTHSAPRIIWLHSLSHFFIFPRRTLQKCVFPRFIPNIFVIIYLHLQN